MATTSALQQNSCSPVTAVNCPGSIRFDLRFVTPRFHLGGELHPHSRPHALLFQHRQNVLRAAVAEQLPQFLLVPANAVAFDHGNKIFRRIAGQRRFGKVRVGRDVIGGAPLATLVKLQRPPPEISIFCPARFELSSTVTERPRFPASMAHISPAAPAPRIRTSEWYFMRKAFADSALLISLRTSTATVPGGHVKRPLRLYSKNSAQYKSHE